MLSVQKVHTRHALVTGGAGFIGSHLCDQLLHDGWRVTCVDNFDSSYDPAVKRKNIRGCLSNRHFRLVECDICDEAVLPKALPDSYDAIFHLAAKPGVRASILAPREFQRVNVGGTQNLLDFARDRGIVQFVFASSSSVYGINPNVPWQESDNVLRPISPYGSTKVSGELLGHVYSRLYGIRFLALRLFTVYGPRQRPDLAMHKFAKLMLAGSPIPFYGDGNTRRDYTHVSDIVSGFVRAVEYRASKYEIFNIGSAYPVTLRELVVELESALGTKAELDQRPEQPGDVPQTWADISLASASLGYSPEMSLSDGMRSFARWVRSGEFVPAHPRMRSLASVEDA